MKKVFVIAEAGVNHNGDIELAKELIFAAKESGADAVKFQNFKASRVISVFANKADYQKNNSDDEESQLAMLSKLELKESSYQVLVEYASKLGILFLSTPKDILSVDVLEKIDIPIYKVGSTEINNYEYIENMLIAKLKVSKYIIPRIPFPSVLLKVILFLLGRNIINPYSQFNSQKLLDLGFERSKKFEEGLSEYIDWIQKENFG